MKLKDISTRAPEHLKKQETKEQMQGMLEELNELQNLLYAESRHSVLVVIQGMDASGKDGVIRNVFGALNPQGVTVASFKAPSPLELSHDFLWRVHSVAPAKGMIGIFNRSHYEDILITRVHRWCNDHTAKLRMEAINDFERLLTRHNSTTIHKFYLHVSKEEQQERLQERLKDPRKQWKYNEKDFEEAELWDEYMKMYEDAFEHCNEVPWTIVPADQNWYKEFLITSELIASLKRLNMQYPGIKQKEETGIA
jgi:PPK2 family polyphosphate:nucleotide phosphotransferase